MLGLFKPWIINDSNIAVNLKPGFRQGRPDSHTSSLYGAVLWELQALQVAAVSDWDQQGSFRSPWGARPMRYARTGLVPGLQTGRWLCCWSLSRTFPVVHHVVAVFLARSKLAC